MGQTHQQEAAIFDAAMELPPEQRAAHLDHACGGDAALRQRIESLLKACESSCGFLDSPPDPVAVGPTNVLPSSFEKAGDRIGRYKLLQQIGEGGCGVVYMAEQEEPVSRRVALKVIKLGLDTKSVIARFEAERQALALMDHPNIAKVLDAGATETGRPYFVMELVRGLKITEYCDEAKLSTNARLDLFIQVCQAIQHAHQKGIIHRDIKPSNILVTINDGMPVPKVIDFGIAKATGGQKLTNKTVFTAFDQFIGTPAYMSPEQAVLTSLDIDTRSDIYALGVLLYELLTGKTPFDAQELLAIGLDEMRRTIREQEPQRPSTRVSTLAQNELSTTAQRRGIDAPKLASELRGDLDWIVMKTLEKDRARRYETANGLAADVQRHLNNEPVVACPPSRLYRLRKTIRRNKLAFAAGSAVAVSLMIGLSLSTVLFFRERAARKRANEEVGLSEAVTRFLQNDLLQQASSFAQARDGFKPDPNLTVREALERAAERIGDRFKNHPLQEAAVRMAIGNALIGIGEAERAIAHLQRALDLRRAKLGADHPDTLKAMVSLALAYGNAGKLEQALPLAEETLKLHKAKLGPDHTNTLNTMNNLAWAYWNAGKPDQALPLAKETLKLSKARLGPDHPDTLSSMNILAITYNQAGKPDLALPLEEEMLKLSKARLGPDHPYTLMSMVNLAFAYLQAGKLDQALPLHEEAVKLLKATLGLDHPHTLHSMGNLAAIYLKARKLDQALPLLEETLKLQKAKQGLDHPDTLRSMYSLASAYKAAGKLDQALPLFEEALKLQKAKLGPEHPHTLDSMNNLAIAYKDAGKLDQALPLFEENLKLRNATLPDHPDTRKARYNLATAYRAAGKLEQLEALYREQLAQSGDGLHARIGLGELLLQAAKTNSADSRRGQDLTREGEQLVREFLAGARTRFTNDPLKLAERLYDAAELRYRQGNYAQAAPLFEETLKLREAKLGLDHTNTLNTMEDVADAYRQAGKLDQALPFFEETLKLRKAKLGPDHPDTLNTMNSLAATYHKTGKLDQSLPLFEETLKLRKAKLGPDHPDTLLSMNNLAIAYREAGKRDQALPLHEETLKLRKAKLGPDHTDTLNTMDNLANAYGEAGKLNQALPLREETLKLRKAKLGPDHPDTLDTMHNLAGAYCKAGKLDQGLPLFEEVLKLRKASQGPDHPNTMNDLASAYFKAGKLDQALPLYEETLKLRKAKLGPDHRDTLNTMNNLAEAYQRAGKFDQALPLLEEVLKLWKTKLGPDHRDTLVSIKNLANAYRDAGKLDQLQAIYREQLAQQSGDVLAAKIGLGRLLLEAAKTNGADSGHGQEVASEGEQLVREFLADARNRYTNDPLALAAKLVDAAELHYRLGNYGEAAPLYREIIQCRRARLSTDHKDVLEPTASLARLLTDWAWAKRDSKSEIRNPKSEIVERAREAERILRDVLAVRLRDGTNSWRIGDVKSRLGGALVSVAVTDPALDAEGRQTQLSQAESLLLEGYERLQNPSAEKKYKRDALQRIVRLYEAWNKPDKRAEWQQKLELLDKAPKKSSASEP